MVKLESLAKKQHSLQTPGYDTILWRKSLPLMPGVERFIHQSFSVLFQTVGCEATLQQRPRIL